MKFVTYLDAAGRPRPGVVRGDGIVPIDAPTLRSYVELAPHERDARHAAGKLVKLAGVALDAPIHPSRNVFCVGRNYADHVREGALAAGKPFAPPAVPAFFTKAPTAIAAPNAVLHLSSRVSSEYDCEAELAVVIGTRCKDVCETEALQYVFGYTALNDVTARDLQRDHRQWFKGKSLDDTCPLGPWIVTPDEIGDAQRLHIGFRRNGITKQSASTSEMLFAIPRIIAELSKGMTLLAGDVIATGTPAGVGFARNPPEFLADGDRVEVEIERIGILANTIRIA